MAGTAATPTLLDGGGGPPTNDVLKFSNLCISVAREIDLAIANHVVPSKLQQLFSLVKQASQKKDDTVLQAAIMVLMVSVKSACQCGWFSDKDSEELSNLAKEVASNFSSMSNFNTVPSDSPLVISTIMSRFYPRMKMGHTFTFLEVKPGYDAYVSYFQISKDIKSSPGDKIRLFVVQTDSIETSSCLVSPAKVNFLLNGVGVESRTNLFMDTGPQIPTVVSPLLNYGSNLLQAVGEFNGNYIIAVSFMSEIQNPDSDVLKDYEQHTPTTVDSDSEVIVGSSRILLNCPISFTRIKTPVKGHSCKHIQCFDFDNYVDINSRRPSWRCPHCNQYVCFTDIRVDKKMVKVLTEVGPNVSEIIVSSDWSWNAVDESEDMVKKPEDKTSTGHDESPEYVNVVDLTQTDDLMDAVTACGNEDQKDSQDAHQHQHVTQTTALYPHIANTNSVNQSTAPATNGFWSQVYMSTLRPLPNVQQYNQVLGVPINGTSLPNTSQWQQYHQFGNPYISNEYGTFQSVPGHIPRTPAAVQALPSQTPTSLLQRSSINSMIVSPNSLLAASQASPASTNLSNMPRASTHQVSPFSSSSLLQRPGIQQNNSVPSAPPPQPSPGFQIPNQVPNAYRIPNGQSSTQPSVPRATSQSPGLIQPSMQSPRGFVHSQSQMAWLQQYRASQEAGLATGQPSYLIAAANRAAQMAYDSPRTVPSYSRNHPPLLGDHTSITGVAAPSQTEQSWCPAGRMRGALSGQAYADAMNQYIIRPSQQAQAARPVPNVPSIPAQAAVQFRPVRLDPSTDILPGTQ